MAKIITIASSKGGVGKTLHAQQLASRASEKHNVMLFGGERDGAFNPDRKINQLRNITMFEGFEKNFMKMIPIFKHEYDLIIADLAGSNINIDTDEFDGLNEKIIKYFITKSDLVIVPCEPSEEAVRKTHSFLRNLREIGKTLDKKMPILVLATDVRSGTKISGSMLDFLETLKEEKTVSYVRHSEDLKQAFALRKGVWKYKKSALVNNDLNPVHHQILTMVGLT